MNSRHPIRSSGSRRQAGLTVLELLVAGVAASIVALAVISLYLSSMQAWGTAGTRLTLQRGADNALERILADVKKGSRVVITNGGSTMAVYRATVSGDSLMVTYTLSNGQVRNNFGVVFADDVTSLQFTSGNGVKVSVEIELYDNRGTPTITGDDQSIHIASTAVCRNQSLY
jgi:hypothetical protein